MRRFACATALSLCLGLAAAVPAPPATAADAMTTLPMATFRDVLVDPAHGHVFLTGGESTGVVVRDLNGAAVTVIADEPGASGLALSPDGATLYVALDVANAIAAIDTTTLAETARYATGANTCPYSLAATGTSLWFGYGCWSGQVGVVDLSGEAPVVTLDRAPAAFDSTAPFVAVAGDRLVAGERSYSPTLSSYVVAGTALTSPVSRALDAPLSDLAVTGDGADVVTAAYDPRNHPRYAVADLAPDGAYGADSNEYSAPMPRAVAAYGGFVAAGFYANDAPDVVVYNAGGTALRGYHLVVGNDNLLPGGLAYGGDGVLYAVTGDGNYGQLHLHVLREASKFPTTIALTKPSVANINTAYQVTGTLTGPGTTLPAGIVVHVRRTSAYGAVTRDVTTGAGGAFAIPDKVTKRGVYTYTATYDGDATRSASTRTLGVYVVGLVPSLTLATDAATYRYGQSARLTAHLGGTHTNRTLRLAAAPYGQATAGIWTGAVGSDGYLRKTYATTRKTVFSATFGGDDIWEPRTVSRTVTAYALIGERLTGYYATSGTYRLYHASVDPGLAVAIAPNVPWGCMRYRAEQYSSGGWHQIASNDCLKMDYAGHVTGYLYGTHPAGAVVRMRAISYGNAASLGTMGDWKYLRFTS